MAGNKLIQGYLIVYNVLSGIVWAMMLFQTISIASEFLRAGKSLTQATRAVSDATVLELRVIQSVALLEIFHAMIGIVRSGVMTTMIQVCSRLVVVWFINYPHAASRYQVGYLMMLISWQLAEVFRYAFYTANLLGHVPSFLLFIRYHLFLVIYPTGVMGEMSCVYSSLPYFATGVFSIAMPNKLNLSISFYTVCIFMLILYPPGLYFLYTHMLGQRRRAYAKTKQS